MAKEQQIVVKRFDCQGYRTPPTEHVVIAWAEAGVYTKSLGSFYAPVEFIRNEHFAQKDLSKE